MEFSHIMELSFYWHAYWTGSNNISDEGVVSCQHVGEGIDPYRVSWSPFEYQLEKMKSVDQLKYQLEKNGEC